MSKSTGIAWCDSTANAVISCTKVSPGCANCYAANDTPARVLRHRGIETWGAKGVRSRVKSFEANMLAMNRRPWICDQCGFAAKDELSNCPKCDGDLTGFHKRIIFCDSNSDWLDEHWPIETFAHYLDVLRRCDQCTLILCTKRTELWDCRMVEVYGYANKSVPEGNNLRDWLQLWIGGQPPKNIILLASVENQVMADKRIPQLLRIPAACHGLSLEPLLSPVDLSKWIWKDSCGCADNEPEPGGGFKCKHCKDTGAVTELEWIIIGGESGPRARPCNVEWISNLVAQGKAAGVPTFVKQLGAKPFIETCPHCGHPEASHGYGRTVGCQHGDGSEANPICGCRKMRDEICHGLGWPMAHHPVKDKKGSDPEEWPDKLRIQQFPTL